MRTPYNDWERYLEQEAMEWRREQLREKQARYGEWHGFSPPAADKKETPETPPTETEKPESTNSE